MTSINVLRRVQALSAILISIVEGQTTTSFLEEAVSIYKKVGVHRMNSVMSGFPGFEVEQPG